eukprot:3532810-Rhodomonas_salina.2
MRGSSSGNASTRIEFRECEYTFQRMRASSSGNVLPDRYGTPHVRSRITGTKNFAHLRLVAAPYTIYQNGASRSNCEGRYRPTPSPHRTYTFVCTDSGSAVPGIGVAPSAESDESSRSSQYEPV